MFRTKHVIWSPHDGVNTGKKKKKNKNEEGRRRWRTRRAGVDDEDGGIKQKMRS